MKTQKQNITKEIKALRSQLPPRGYTGLILECAEKSGKPLTIDIVKQFFAGRKIAHHNKVVVIKSAHEAIGKLRGKDQELSALLKGI